MNANSAVVGLWDRVRGLRVPVLHRMAGTDGVALTIDDGPTPEATAAILDLLNHHRVPASFFVSGIRAEQHPDLLARMVSNGHQVCNHGYAHLRLDRIDERAVAADLARAEDILNRVRPSPSPYPLRLPFGEGWRVRSVHRAISAWRSDVRIVQWTRHAHDWDIAGRCVRADDIVHECSAPAAELTRPAGLDGAILLLHDKPIDATHALSGQVAVAFLEQVLAALKAAHVPVVPLDIR